MAEPAHRPQTRGDIPTWDLPDRLIKARNHAHMTQRDLAEALDISVRTVNRYEAGDPIKRGYLLGWAFATGVDPTWLERGNTGNLSPGSSDWYDGGSPPVVPPMAAA